MGKSVVTDQWKNHLYKYFREHGDDDKIKVLDSVDWNVSLGLVLIEFLLMIIFFVRRGCMEKG
jgi:hypothetical protein